MHYVRIAWRASVLLVLAFAVCMGGVICSGRAVAHPFDAPQVGDFVPRTFLCTGEFSPMSNNQVAEFSGTWMGPRNAIIKIVEIKDGQPSDDIDGTLSVGVDDKIYSSGNFVVLNGTTGGQGLQSVVLRVEGIRPSQEFAIYASWFPKLNYVKLAQWYGNEKDKCGDPLAQYGPN